MGMAPLGRVKQIKWKIYSKIDKRWNKSGKCTGFISLSPRAANNWLKKCRKKYSKQPSDLMYEASRVW